MPACCRDAPQSERGRVRIGDARRRCPPAAARPRSARPARRRRPGARAIRRSRAAGPTSAHCGSRGRSAGRTASPATSPAASSPISASVRAPKTSCARLPGPRPRATPRANAAPTSPACVPAVARRPRMLCCEQHAPHLAGHVRHEVDDAAALDARPFAVRAGQRAQHALVARADRAGDLRFLAAHHVGHAVGVARAHAGHDGEAAARNVHQAGDQVGQLRRALDVRRFDPALAAADHSARDARRRVVVPVAEQRRERVREPPVLHVLDAERRAARPGHGAARRRARTRARRSCPSRWRSARSPRGARAAGAGGMR